MKNRLTIGFSLLSLLIGAFFVNGCKDTATDPGFVPLAEIRFADFHQIEPVQIFMYPPNSTAADSVSKTPTSMTYGLVTPYFTNIPTNRTAGETYHLVAIQAGSISKAYPQGVTVADVYVTLMPGDRKTWMISGNGKSQGGSFDQTLIDDSHPDNQSSNFAYFRFLNVNPNFDPPLAPQGQGLSLIVGDPLSGMALATGIHYKAVSAYVGIPIAKDTSVTFYVVNPANGAVLSRLAGVGLAGGSYHTITWGGQVDSNRIPDPNTGNLTLNDTVRIRILDDDQGTDITVTAPLTFRFNIINALTPPNSWPKAGLVDYSQSGGLAIVINNNTVYDYQGLMPFSLAPRSIKSLPGSGTNPADSVVWNVVPTVTPLVDKIIIAMVRPVFKDPSPADSTIFKFYAGNGKPFKSDALYAIVVFDSAKLNGPKATDLAAPFDSAGRTLTVPIPDVPIKDSARIVLGYMLGYVAASSTVKETSNNSAKLFFNIGNGDVQDLNDFSTGRLLKAASNGLGSKPKTFDSSLVVPADGRQVTLKAVVSTDAPYTFTFTPENGAIYEAFLVGERNRKDDPKYSPRFMVIRINPKNP